MFTRKFFAAFVAAVSMAMMTSSVYAQNPDLGVTKGPRTDGDLLNSENVFKQADGSYVRLNLAEDGESLNMSDVNNSAASAAYQMDNNYYIHWLVIRNKQTGQEIKKEVFRKRHTGWHLGFRLGAEYRVNAFGPTAEIEGSYEGVNNIFKGDIGIGIGEYVKTSVKAGEKYLAPSGQISWQYKIVKSKKGTLERFYFAIGLYAEASFRKDINYITEIAPLADGQEPRTDAVEGMNGSGGIIFTASWLIDKVSGAKLQFSGMGGLGRAYQDFGHVYGPKGGLTVGFTIPLSRKTYTPKVGASWAKAHGKTNVRIADPIDFTYGNRPYQSK